jgi:hypothetical protein
VALFEHADPYSGTVTWTGDEASDLLQWLTELSGCPPITHPKVLLCERHVDEPQFTGYVQADPQEGVARRRCVACAQVTDLIDSGERWTFPDTHECPSCCQSLVELAVGVSADDDGHAHWLALASRCVGCGRISGLTDAVLHGEPVEQVLASV